MTYVERSTEVPFEASIASRIDHGRAQRRRAHDLGAGPAGRALDHHPVRVEQLDLAAELVELGEVDRAVLVDPVVEQRLALRDRRDHREERQVVDVEARERHRVDLVERGGAAATAWVVRSTSRVWPLARDVLLGAVVAEAHLLEQRQLDLEELDRHPPDGDRRLGDDGGGEQRHRLDRVLGRRVVDVDVDLRAAGARSAWWCRCRRRATPSFSRKKQRSWTM